jgi:hypothetical protein
VEKKIINIKYILFSLYVLVLTFQEIFDLPAILYSIQILTFSEILELSPIIYKFLTFQEIFEFYMRLNLTRKLR